MGKVERANTADPAAWLRERGFDSERALCVVVCYREQAKSISAAMCEAAFAGGLSVSDFLWASLSLGTWRGFKCPNTEQLLGYSDGGRLRSGPPLRSEMALRSGRCYSHTEDSRNASSIMARRRRTPLL